MILHGIFHVLSRFPLHFMFYPRNLDCFSNSVASKKQFFYFFGFTSMYIFATKTCCSFPAELLPSMRKIKHPDKYFAFLAKTIPLLLSFLSPSFLCCPLPPFSPLEYCSFTHWFLTYIGHLFCI